MKITASNNNGSIVIRFTYNGIKYSLSKLGSFHETKAIDTAKFVASKIESDIHMGRFTAENSLELFFEYHPYGKDAKVRSQKKATESALQILIQLKEVNGCEANSLRQPRLLLMNYGKEIYTHEDALKFIKWLDDGTRKPQSINHYLQVLKPTCPMFAGIMRLKPLQAKVEEPFTLEEIGRIIKSFDKNFPHYVDFVRFLFSTGCRPSEAAAFSFANINLKRGTITIKDAIAKDSTGKKAFKDTKTGISRTFPVSDTLLQILRTRQVNTSNLDLTDLVFTSSRKCIIDVNTFRWNYWKLALEKADVEYRTLYNTRHTFISHYIEKYKDYQKCAAITHGSKSGVQTIIKHYSHLVSEIQTLDLF